MGYFNSLALMQTSLERMVIRGKGVGLNDMRSIKRIANRKWLTLKNLEHLLQLAYKDEGTGMIITLENTKKCLHKTIVHGDRMYGQYCRTRICLVCNANKRASFINRYLKEISTWGYPTFLTLTGASVKEHHLGDAIDSLLKSYYRIKNSEIRKRKRQQANPIKGIQFIECQHNPDEDTYNPHIHLILDSKEAAESLRSRWLKCIKVLGCKPEGQNLQTIGSSKNSLIRILIYSSKEFSNYSKITSDSVARSVAKGTYAIFAAFRNRKLHHRFGFSIDPVKPLSTSEIIVTDSDEFIFSMENCDWVPKNTI